MNLYIGTIFEGLAEAFVNVRTALRPSDFLFLHLRFARDRRLFKCNLVSFGQFGCVRRHRHIPVVGDESIAIAKSYEGIADLLLLDSHRPGDTQIGALGVTHSWDLDRKIVERVDIPVLIAGGLGPDNVVDAIKAVRPAGVDSKTKTDKDDG